MTHKNIPNRYTEAAALLHAEARETVATHLNTFESWMVINNLLFLVNLEPILTMVESYAEKMEEILATQHELETELAQLNTRVQNLAAENKEISEKLFATNRGAERAALSQRQQDIWNQAVPMRERLERLPLLIQMNKDKEEEAAYNLKELCKEYGLPASAPAGELFERLQDQHTLLWDEVEMLLETLEDGEGHVFHPNFEFVEEAEPTTATDEILTQYRDQSSQAAELLEEPTDFETEADEEDYEEEHYQPKPVATTSSFEPENVHGEEDDDAESASLPILDALQDPFRAMALQFIGLGEDAEALRPVEAQLQENERDSFDDIAYEDHEQGDADEYHYTEEDEEDENEDAAFDLLEQTTPEDDYDRHTILATIPVEPTKILHRSKFDTEKDYRVQLHSFLLWAYQEVESASKALTHFQMKNPQVLTASQTDLLLTGGTKKYENRLVEAKVIRKEKGQAVFNYPKEVLLALIFITLLRKGSYNNRDLKRYAKDLDKECDIVLNELL